MIFTMKDTTEYFYELESFKNDVLTKEGFTGYRIVEDEHIEDTVLVYFKDKKYQENVERYFVLHRDKLSEFHNLYEYYSKNPYNKYQKILELKEKVMKLGKNFIEIFRENEVFFSAINISFGEWKGFNGVFDKPSVAA